MSKKFVIAAAVAIWVACTPAAGGIITATFLGVSPSQAVHISDGSGPGLSINTLAGIFNLQIQPGTTYAGLGAVGDTFAAFCIDLGNTIAQNQTYTWNVVEPTDAPDPSVYSDGPVSAAELLSLQKLVGANPISSLTTGALAAAFQAAVWEIVNESGSIYDVTAGNFIASGGLNTTLANQMLTASASYTGPLPELMALTNPGVQDLLVIIPEPASVATLGAGMGVLALRWNRRRR